MDYALLLQRHVLTQWICLSDSPLRSSFAMSHARRIRRSRTQNTEFVRLIGKSMNRKICLLSLQHAKGRINNPSWLKKHGRITDWPVEHGEASWDDSNLHYCKHARRTTKYDFPRGSVISEPGRNFVLGHLSRCLSG